MGLMLMTVPNVYLSFLARATHEAGDGLMGALATIFISRLFERRNVGGNAGLLMGIFTLGNMVGAQLFSPLGYSLGLQFPFLIAGGLMVLDCGFGYIVFKKVAY
jgi:MFS family permease